MSMMICALCKVQRIAYTKLASAFDSDADASSSLRRIQRLIAECIINTDLIAKLILKLIPVKGPYSLSMDRTNWKFSNTNINILTLGIIYEGMAFPIVFKMMDKRGNSNTEERMELIRRFCALAGESGIAHLVADREFVGSEWLAFLNSRGIHYHIRIRENFRVIRHGKESKAHWLFTDLKLGECKHLSGIYYVNGQPCYLSGSKIKDKEGKPELQILVSYCNAEEALDMYRQRWQIETMFKGLKSSGFNIEDSHVRIQERMANLFSIVMIAYVWCYLVGIYIHENIKEIKVLHHGRKAKSLFKYGLEYISQCLLNHTNRYRIDIFKFLSYTQNTQNNLHCVLHLEKAPKEEGRQEKRNGRDYATHNSRINKTGRPLIRIKKNDYLCRPEFWDSFSACPVWSKLNLWQLFREQRKHTLLKSILYAKTKFLEKDSWVHYVHCPRILSQLMC